jgi:tetratricopeptide (TPR) repeat protein
MLSCLKMYEERNIDKDLAIVASNLSELYLTLGALHEAVDVGRQAVEFADRSGDGFYKEASRAALADALHQSGQSADAEQLFVEAEAMQRVSEPAYTFLYSLRGYKYCDLLLEQGKWEDVLKRAVAGFLVSTQNNWLSNIALDHISIARAYARAAAQTEGNPSHRDTAEETFNRAVEGLRKSGDSMYLPNGLLARAHWRLQTGRPAAAFEDLDEVYEIAESGSMGLYLVDWHIAMSRLRRMEGNDAAAAKHKVEALRRVRETGYLRRLEEAEGL